MTHPSVYARTQPNKIAYQMAGTAKAITYRELDELSNQGAPVTRPLICSAHFGEVMTTLAPQSLTI